MVTLPGTHKLKTVCNLIVGEHALRVEAFVMRQPDENREELWAWLLQRNARMYGVAFSIDAVGDVYLTGRAPLQAVDADELDRLLGAVLTYADESLRHDAGDRLRLVDPARVGVAGQAGRVAGQPAPPSPTSSSPPARPRPSLTQAPRARDPRPAPAVARSCSNRK